MEQFGHSNSKRDTFCDLKWAFSDSSWPSGGGKGPKSRPKRLRRPTCKAEVGAGTVRGGTLCAFEVTLGPLLAQFGATLESLGAYFWHMKVAVEDFGATLS